MRRLWAWYVATACVAAEVSACGGDDVFVAPPLPDAAVDSGVSVDATSGDAPADHAVSPVDAGIDAPARDAAGIDAPARDAAGDAGATAYGLFVGTDFANAELSVVSLRAGVVAGRLALGDQDSVPYASGGFGFVVEHGLGKGIVLDRAMPWTVSKTIDVNDGPDAGAYTANPRTVLVTTGTKAYVARYASNVVKIVDVASGAATGGIDLSAFMAPDDTDGLVDAQDGFYDATSQRAYFLLQRINQFDFSGSAPDYVAACLASHGQIVGVDVTTDTIIDLNGAAAGQAIDLLGDNPASLTAVDGDRFIVPETGCYELPDGGADAGPALRVGRGVESVVVATATPSWLYQTTDVDRISAVLWVDDTHAFLNAGPSWFPWNPTQTTLGGAVAAFPQAAFYDGTRIVGLAAEESDAGVTWSVVALDVASSQVSTIAGAPFQSVVPATSFGVTSALLR